MIKLCRAEQQDAALLTEIAKESKAHWGYPSEWLEQWTEELTITEQQITDDYLVKAIDGEKVLGFAALCKLADSNTLLDLQHLWIRPTYLKQGLGRMLFDHMIDYSIQLGTHSHLQVLSDPYAEGFYAAMGCKVMSHEPSSIEGRTLPLMQRPIHL